MLLRVPEAAAYIGKGQTTLRAKMKSGEIAFYQEYPGAWSYLDTAELDRYLASIKRDGKPSKRVNMDCKPAKHINGTLRKRRS